MILVQSDTPDFVPVGRFLSDSEAVERQIVHVHKRATRGLRISHKALSSAVWA